MQANYTQRLRLIFSKTGPTRFIGHLDLARTLERSINRARIPIAYSQGFNKRPRMALATALPLGFTSECELADIWLTETMEPEQVKAQLMTKMAPGITIHQIEDVALKEPNLQTLTTESTYAVTLLDPVDTTVLQQRIADLLEAETHLRKRGHGRKRKTYDLRPLIFDLSLVEGSDPIQLTMRLALEPGKNGRPDEVLLALDLDPLAARIHRNTISLRETELG